MIFEASNFPIPDFGKGVRVKAYPRIDLELLSVNQ